MSKNIIYLLVFAIVLGFPVSQAIFGISFQDAKSIVSWGYEVFSKMNEAYDAYGTYAAETSLDTILDGIRDISDKLDDISNRLSLKINTLMETLLRRIPLIQRRDEALQRLAIYLGIIDRLYQNFERYTAVNASIDRYTLIEFARTVTSSRNMELPDVMFRMRRLVLPEYGNIVTGIFDLISQETQEAILELCNTILSPQQRIFQLYNTIMIAEMKAYVTTTFAYTVLRSIEDGFFEQELKIAAKDFEQRTKIYVTVIARALKNAPRSVRRCEPMAYIRGKTFLEMEKFMQLYIVNEVDLSRSTGCESTCSEMSLTKKHTSCYDAFFCNTEFCNGTLTDCHFAGGPMSACKLPSTSSRRYVFFEDFHGMNGPGPDCPRYLHASQSWFSGWTRGFLNCHYCTCTCVEDAPTSTSIRTISFRNQIADIENNMVVVGIKFEYSGGMIHPKIQQAPLLPEGLTGTNNKTWVPLRRTEYHPRASVIEKWGVFYEYYEKSDGTEGSFKLRFGRDFGMLSLPQRELQLDEILLPDDYVVTGVRFKHTAPQDKPWHYRPFRFEVHGTPFDYDTGRLIPSDEKPSMWFNAGNMTDRPGKYYDRDRKKVRLVKPGNPTDSRSHLPDSEPNSFINFQESDIRTDAGQSTVPFFDAQQVGGKVPFPLNGIGLFHKGYEGSGGFLAFRIYALDITNFIKLPEVEKTIDYEDYDSR